MLLPVLAAVLAFITIGGVGWVLVGGDDSSGQAVKRAKVLATSRTESVAAAKRAAVANTPEARRKQIMVQLREVDRRERKARMTTSAKLKQAGLELSLRTFVVISVVMGLIGALLAFVLGGNILIVLGVGIAMGLGLPRWVVNMKAKARMKKFSLAFPDAVDVLVRGIKTGLPVHDCFKVIARESPEPLAGEFRLLVEGMGVGLTLADALDKMYMRMPTPELKFFAIVIAIQQKSGGNLAEQPDLGAARPADDGREDQGHVVRSRGLGGHHRLPAAGGDDHGDPDQPQLHEAAVHRRARPRDAAGRSVVDGHRRLRDEAHDQLQVLRKGPGP